MELGILIAVLIIVYIFVESWVDYVKRNNKNKKD